MNLVCVVLLLVDSVNGANCLPGSILFCRFSEHIREHERHHSPSSVVEPLERRVLPILALNDVFIGESLSARYITVYQCPIGLTV